MCTTKERRSSPPDPRRRWRATSRGCTRRVCGRLCSTSPDVNGWRRSGATVLGQLDRHEAAVLRGLVAQIEDMLRARAAEAPRDELAELTGIRTGPATAPDDPILSRLLPDFHRLDDDPPDKAAVDS